MITWPKLTLEFEHFRCEEASVSGDADGSHPAQHDPHEAADRDEPVTLIESATVSHSMPASVNRRQKIYGNHRWNQSLHLIWFDLIWFDLIWFDLIWFDLISLCVCVLIMINVEIHLRRWWFGPSHAPSVLFESHSRWATAHWQRWRHKWTRNGIGAHRNDAHDPRTRQRVSKRLTINADAHRLSSAPILSWKRKKRSAYILIHIQRRSTIVFNLFPIRERILGIGRLLRVSCKYWNTATLGHAPVFTSFTHTWLPLPLFHVGVGLRTSIV